MIITTKLQGTLANKTHIFSKQWTVIDILHRQTMLMIKGLYKKNNSIFTKVIENFYWGYNNYSNERLKLNSRFKILSMAIIDEAKGWNKWQKT